MVVVVEGEPDDMGANLEAFRARVFAAAESSIEWATAPMVHFRDGKCVELRTGILIQIASMRFLVTASHGLIEHNNDGGVLHIVLPEKGAVPVPLVREWFWSTKNPQEDIAVTQLHDSTVAALGNHFRYWRLSDIMRQNDPLQHKGLYLLMGYPLAMVRPDETGIKRTDTWKYLTTSYHGDYANVQNYDPGLHLILDYERSTQNREGQKVHPPGLSGCGIWFLRLPIAYPLCDEVAFKLVGIQTAWHKGCEYVKGTWIDDVLLVLWTYYSDARSAMLLHGIRF